MSQKINLLFTCNKNYIMPCVVAMTSIFENDKESLFNVFILHSGIGDFEKEKLKELENKYKCEIKEIKVDDKYFTGIDSKRWSKELWYRLLVEEYIPKDIDRIFNLDCDIIVTDSLLKFYNIDFDGKYLIAPYFDDAATVENSLRLNLPKDYIYFPSAFLLYDLNKIREILNYDNILENINKYKDILNFPEMDLLNILFHDKVKIISKDFYYVGDDRYGRGNKIPSIIHYSASKPWHNLIRGRYDDIWLKYLKLSPYSYLYEEKYDNLKIKFLRSKITRLFIRTFLGSSVFMTLDKILPKNIHSILRNIYRKYFK